MTEKVKWAFWTNMISHHDDVIQWKHFPCCGPFVQGIPRSLVNSPHKGQWRGALMFSLIRALNKRLSKQSWGWWFETLSCSLWRHCNNMLVKNRFGRNITQCTPRHMHMRCVGYQLGEAVTYSYVIMGTSVSQITSIRHETVKSYGNYISCFIHQPYKKQVIYPAQENCLSIPKRQRWNRWSLGIDK